MGGFRFLRIPHRRREHMHHTLRLLSPLPLLLAALACSPNASFFGSAAGGAGGQGGAGAAGSANACDSGTAECGAECVDLTSDEANCGSCGNVCDFASACVEGACEACPAATFVCDGRCTRIEDDPNNCGSCGNICEGETECSNFSCRCDAPNIACGGACVNPNSDPNNCGACNTKCAMGDVCKLGDCAPDCGGTLWDCSGSCIDPYTDPNHCGGCNMPCGQGDDCINAACECSSILCGACGVITLPGTVPQSVTGTTFGKPDVLMGMCHPSLAEQAYSFTAPQTGTYVFDTIGSNIETVLSVRNSNCFELACEALNVPGPPPPASQVFVSLQANQQVLVLVEEAFGAGNFKLNIKLQ
jgi:hypothetical protein